ncbi:MAG: uroporphyrinogen-III synthase [Gluconacetobacter diazotrophicus]|nr:uroporphyrinogen-III synthase [Gluconacetobacter diazotrophicus]
MRERGFEVLVAPVQRIVPVDLRLPDAAWTRVQAVLVTSGQALPALRMVVKVPGERLLLAVGDATARRARDAGFAAVESAGGDAAALRRLAAARLKPERGKLLLASGRGQGMELARGLRADGFRVWRRVAYRAVAARALPDGIERALGDGTVRAAMFFSAEAARIFRRTLPAGSRDRLREVRALAISRRTVIALDGMGWAEVVVAASPDAAAMLALLDGAGRDG